MGWSRPDLEMPELQTRAPPGPPRPSVASVRRLSPSWRLLPGSPHLDYPTWTTPTGGRPLAKAALRLRTLGSWSRAGRFGLWLITPSMWHSCPAQGPLNL
jgi:hypothetical protein